jgi:hypothetical protein
MFTTDGYRGTKALSLASWCIPHTRTTHAVSGISPYVETTAKRTKPVCNQKEQRAKQRLLSKLVTLQKTQKQFSDVTVFLRNLTYPVVSYTKKAFFCRYNLSWQRPAWVRTWLIQARRVWLELANSLLWHKSSSPAENTNTKQCTLTITIRTATFLQNSVRRHRKCTTSPLQRQIDEFCLGQYTSFNVRNVRTLQ